MTGEIFYFTKKDGVNLKEDVTVILMHDIFLWCRHTTAVVGKGDLHLHFFFFHLLFKTFSLVNPKVAPKATANPIQSVASQPKPPSQRPVEKRRLSAEHEANKRMVCASAFFSRLHSKEFMRALDIHQKLAPVDQELKRRAIQLLAIEPLVVGEVVSGLQTTKELLNPVLVEVCWSALHVSSIGFNGHVWRLDCV